jgi:ADP-ribose pyrophosphatase YjhB (NUDIX family)
VSQRPTLGASIAVFRDGRVLLAQRALPPLGGLWSLPGGRVEPGERLADAALRELMEEVGVEAELVDFAGYTEVLPGGTRAADAPHFVVLAFAGRWRAGEPQPGAEASAIAWVDPATLGGLPTTAGLGPIVARAARIVAEAG